LRDGQAGTRRRDGAED